MTNRYKLYYGSARSLVTRVVEGDSATVQQVDKGGTRRLTVAEDGEDEPVAVVTVGPSDVLGYQKKDRE